MDQATTEINTIMETSTIPVFIAKPLNPGTPARCVDGRPSQDSPQGPQMLGGSLHPILLGAIYHNTDFDRKTIVERIATFQESGIQTGAHRDTHGNETNSGCGFADRLPDILATAVKNRAEITQGLENLYKANRQEFPTTDKSFAALVENAYAKIAAFSLDKIGLVGNPLVTTLEQSGSSIETVEGGHAEEIAFVNTAEGTTLDTRALNGRSEQGFNLDLPEVEKQAKILGIPEEFTKPASLILYKATEMVLVEDKGKPALPVEIHS